MKFSGIHTMLLQRTKTSESTMDNYIPPNPFGTLMVTLFNDEDTADIVLKAGEGEKERKFFTHSLILKKCAPELASLCDGCDKSEPLYLPSVQPDILNELLRYVYGGTVSYEKWKGRHQEFIDAADRYGIVNLKVEAEVRYVKDESTEKAMTLDTAIEMLRFAESKNCPLLREHAVAFIMVTIAKSGDTMDLMDSFKNFPISESILKEILCMVATLVVRTAKLTGVKANEKKFRTIGMLRKELSTKGLEIDGSRQVLMARLEENKKEDSVLNKKEDSDY